MRNFLAAWLDWLRVRLVGPHPDTLKVAQLESLVGSLTVEVEEALTDFQNYRSWTEGVKLSLKASRDKAFWEGQTHERNLIADFLEAGPSPFQQAARRLWARDIRANKQEEWLNEKST